MRSWQLFHDFGREWYLKKNNNRGSHLSLIELILYICQLLWHEEGCARKTRWSFHFLLKWLYQFTKVICRVYICVCSGVDFVSGYDFSIILLNSSDGVIFFAFHFIIIWGMFAFIALFVTYHSVYWFCLVINYKTANIIYISNLNPRCTLQVPESVRNQL